MEMNHCLPFKVGQEAESKSFLKGFRGAWFRCKIKGVRFTKGRINYALEFFDFPDEKIKWTQAYQKHKVNHEEGKMHLMVRPSFPLVFRESQMRDICAISELVAIVDNEWKVGDLVDWWTDGCYWSGKITHLLGEDKVEIKLLEPPLGEGKSYEASCKDLRPSLDWSLVHGWTLPISMENETAHCCVRLIRPMNQASEEKNEHCSEEVPCEIGATYSQGSSDSSPCSSKQMPKQPSNIELSKEVPDLSEDGAASVSSHSSSGTLPSLKKEILKQPSDSGPSKEVLDSGDNGLRNPTFLDSALGQPNEDVSRKILKHPSDGGPNKEVLDSDVNGLGNPTFFDTVSKQPNEDISPATAQTTGRRDRYKCFLSTKEMSSVIGCMNTSFSDTIESSVLDLEELASRIKWLKRVHQFGLQSANAVVPSWKFQQERVSFPHRL